MEAGLISLFNILVEKGLLTAVSIEILTLVALYYVFRLYLKPMKSKMDDVPSIEDIKTAFGKFEITEKSNFNELGALLNKLAEYLDEIDDTDKANSKELNEIRKDIEQVKQILNQFQGHMMYSAVGARRTTDFGNRELK